MTYTDKTYFKEGDVVTLRQDMPYKPTMMVQKVEKYKMTPGSGDRSLLGIKTIWFTKDGMMQTHLFNFKDLIHVGIQE
jgi:hypothetical protein